jgi:hypothetical protein
MPVDDAVEPVKPGLGVTPIPAHGVVVMVGPGTLIMGLTPALPISVEPSGSVPPESADDVFAPGFDSGDAVPVDDNMPDDVEAQLPEVTVPIPVVPPPSKVDAVPGVALVPAVEDADAADVAIPEESMPAAMQLGAPAIEPIGAGLKPPGSISVAPSGIPVGEAEDVEPGMPSGEVAPMLGVPIAVCARLALPLNSIATASTNKRRIETSCTVCRSLGGCLQRSCLR